MISPKRGEIWLVDLDPTKGREQAGQRPGLVVSHDVFNAGPAELVVVVPLTSTIRPIPSHIRLLPPEGGLERPSAALCEAVRSISRRRFVRKWGVVGADRMKLVDDALRVILSL